MKLLRSNLPSTATRTGFGPAQPLGLNLVIEAEIPSYVVRPAEPPTWKGLRVSATLPTRFSKGHRTSYSQPTSHPTSSSRARSPIAGRTPPGCTWDSFGDLVRASDNEAAQGLSDLTDDDIPHRRTRAKRAGTCRHVSVTYQVRIWHDLPPRPRSRPVYR